MQTRCCYWPSSGHWSDSLCVPKYELQWHCKATITGPIPTVQSHWSPSASKRSYRKWILKQVCYFRDTWILESFIQPVRHENKNDLCLSSGLSPMCDAISQWLGHMSWGEYNVFGHRSFKECKNAWPTLKIFFPHRTNVKMRIIFLTG
jgi:hypothetical protein